MVWVYIALSIPIAFLLLLHFLRFHFNLSIETPSTFRGSVGVSFFRFRREVTVDAAQAVMGRQAGHKDQDGDAEDDEEGEDGDLGDREAGAWSRNPNFKISHPPASGPASAEAPVDPDAGQRGALRLPDSWHRLADRFQKRIHKAATKWVLDPGVWRILFRFTMESGRRVLGLLHPALEFLHLSLDDVFDLGRIAAAWSVIRGTIPALACPVEFGFAQPFAFRARVSGGFSGLNLLLFGLMTLFSFPWVPLGSRFVHCWNDSRLTRWQRRVLLP
jgi:hypothetical protein